MIVEQVFLAEKGEYSTDHLVDLFAGCGGSGGGLLDANRLLGREVRGTFVNHWDKALQIHQANHPTHRHLEEDLFLLDPCSVFPVGTSCSLLWASPSCTHFSIARGSACVTDQGRSHAFTVVDWVRHLRPEALICENVKEFRSYGPTVQKRDTAGELCWALGNKPIVELSPELKRRKRESDGEWSERVTAAGYAPHLIPDPERKGEYFESWLAEMSALGYDHEHKLLKSADYGDPTIRVRLFIYFVRRDSGKKIVWPEAYAEDRPKPGKRRSRPMLWRTARDIIDWNLKGSSVFTREKGLADNTFRRLAIGVVKYGLRELLDAQPCDFVVPKDRGYDGRNVRATDTPVSAITQNHRGEGLCESSIIQLKGQSTAQSVDVPLTSQTGCQAHYLSTSMIDHLRGTGVVSSADAPLKTITTSGSHQAVAEAFMLTLGQTGGATKFQPNVSSVDAPLRTVVTKAHSSCIEVDLEVLSSTFLQTCEDRGVDTKRAETFLRYVCEELHKKGYVDAKPWIYVYYSSGAEGSLIDSPLPTVRTKAGHALVYPVIELHGKLLKIDLLYRMLTPLELQRAMGFPDDMSRGGCNQTDFVRGIGNSVSRGVARALGLAWYSQDPDVWKHVKHIYE